MQNVQRNRLDQGKRNKGMVKLCLAQFGFFFIETVAKSPQISEKDLCKWDDIIYLSTEGKEFP